MDNNDKFISDTLKDMISRLDERMKFVQESLIRIGNDINAERNATDVKIDNSNEKIDHLKKWTEDNFVKKETFSPIQKIVYGVVTLIMTGVFGAILGLVLIR